jgi:integrase
MAAKTPLKWAVKENIISYNPADLIPKFSADPKKRDVLTVEEAEKMFSLPWKDKRAYVGNLLAITTGLRIGEIRGLRRNDIDQASNNLFVCHSWCAVEKLKPTTKNGESRIVPIFSEVKDMLNELLNESPHRNEENPFIFYSNGSASILTDRAIFIDGFKEAIEKIGIDKKRNIVFHSHRHFYATRMVDQMTAEEVSRITGHKSKDAFDKYADHIVQENLSMAMSVGREVFAGIIPRNHETEDEMAKIAL